MQVFSRKSSRFILIGLCYVAGYLNTASAQPFAYVSNVSGNVVTIVNPADGSILGSVRVPSGPTGLAVTPDGLSVYVSSQGAASVSVISTSTNTVVNTIPVGSTPVSVAISPNGTQAFVVDQGSNQLSIINTASQSVIATLPVGSRPEVVAVSPDGSRAFVTNLYSNTVSVIDTASRSVVANWATLTGPNGVAVAPNGRVYIANQYSDAVTVHDSAGNILSTISGFSEPNSVAITPSGNRVFVVNGNGSVGVIDTGSNSVIGTVGVGSIPTSVAISTDGTRAFVTNEYSFSVSVIDTSSDALVNTIARVGVYPVAIAMKPAAITQGTPPPAALSSVSINPTVITGGQSATGTVTLTAAAGSGGAAVSLSNSNPGVANVPASVMIPQGNSSATFPVSSGAVGAPATVNVTGSYSGVSVSTTLTVNPVASSAKASFVGLDTGTQGNWKSAYGGDGYSLAADGVANPSYVTPSASGQLQWTWAASTTDIRALQKAAASDRIAATWYSPSSFTIDVNITDGNTHRVALYCLDYDSKGRAETVSVLDSSGAVLDSRSISGFTNGQYLVWNISGHAIFRLSLTGGANAVVSGIFFGGGSPSVSSSNIASFLKTDSTTQGFWKGTYGGEGYNVVGDGVSYPAYSTPSVSGQLQWTWAASTTDVRALQKVASSDRVAATWYSFSNFTIDVNITDGRTHQVALYCLDYDSLGRAETIYVLDPSGTVLDSRSISGFTNGQYLVWNVAGHVTFKLALAGGANAVVSGIFFGGGSTSSSNTASFLKVDSTTQGFWKGTYGANGYNVVGDTASYPSYASVNVAGQQQWIWAASTTDIRALQKASASDRVAATWYSFSNFTIDVNLTDGQLHQVALYCLDYDSQGRAQTISVLDPSGAVLDSRSISGFTNGQYLVWSVRGHVTFRVTSTGGANAVVSGIFF